MSQERPFAFTEYDDYSKNLDNPGSRGFILANSEIRQEMVAKLFPRNTYDPKILDLLREKIMQEKVL